MADFSRKRNLANRAPVTRIGTDEPVDLMRYYTKHATKPGLVDLNEFSTGVTAGLTDGINRFSYSFTGRPTLIQELAPIIYKRFKNAPSTTLGNVYSCLRWWWRFFDAFEATQPEGTRLTSSADWNSVHYAFYRIGQLRRTKLCTTAGMFFTMLREAREPHGLHFWWTSIDPPGRQRELLSEDEVRRIYQFIRRRARLAKERMENIRQLRDNFHTSSDIEKRSSDEYPTMQDALVLFMLFVIQSGWNPQVVLDINVKDRDENGDLLCIRRSLNKPESHSRVLSFKDRANGSIQQTESWDKQTYSPSNIIRMLVKQTEPLRAQIEVKISALKEKIEQARYLRAEPQEPLDDIEKMEVSLKDLESRSRSPWLFFIHSKRYLGQTGVLHGKNLSTQYKHERVMAIQWVIKSINDDLAVRLERAAAKGIRLPRAESPIREGIVLTDFRDAFLVWRYEDSGYSWLEALLASGSSSLSSLQSYFKKKRIIAHARDEMVKGSEAIWNTINTTAATDVASINLPILVAGRVAGATDDQVNRWLSGRERTYTGTGCRDIRNPPRRIDPAHKSGRTCQSQRCLICPEHAVLITDSRGADDLAKVRAELMHVKSILPVTTWAQSNWPDELNNAEIAWREFTQLNIDERYAWWIGEIKAGRHIPIQLEGYYDEAA